MRHTLGKSLMGVIVGMAIMLTFTPTAQAVINGLTGTRIQINGTTRVRFDLETRDGYISTPDGGSIYVWGYAPKGSPVETQYPGPTLLLQQGDEVTVTLTNALPAAAGNVSLLFPGHTVVASGGAQGDLTQEAVSPPPGGMPMAVTYTFTATEPGTYTYYSGTETGFQTDMGLMGAMVVYPTTPNQAYSHASSAYDYEYLFLLSEMDLALHQEAETLCYGQIDTTNFFPVYWFINGRSAPDTMAMAGVPWLPNQPYNCMPRMVPGSKMLMRFVGAGRDCHPFHHHGNNAWAIARNGRLLTSDPTDPTKGADLAESDFTQATCPGDTIDAIFEWTGKGLGWDVYGHQHDLDNDPTGNFPGPEDVDHNDNGTMDIVPSAVGEYLPDHGKPFPVNLPEGKELAFGGMYSGSPYLGTPGALPPGEGGMNRFGGFTYMWHSHNEKEMTSNDLFPGGMMTMGVVDPPGTPIPTTTMP